MSSFFSFAKAMRSARHRLGPLGFYVMASITIIAATAIVDPASAVMVQAPPAPYAQHLTDQLVAENPDLLNVLFHITPPGDTRNMVAAAHLSASIGEISGEDDLGVVKTGRPLSEVQKDGVRIGIVVQLQDSAGHSIGALGLMYPFHKGDAEAAFMKRSVAIRDALAKQIPSSESLFAKS